MKLYLVALTIQANLFHMVDLFNLPISKVWVIRSINLQKKENK
ncbi:hypothetical protein [Helicobacter pylori]|nr:hypothetical protein [Helicobacter pylori]AHN39821.1 hypothetical protein HPOKI154_07190 [Helicobacter pylori oki154]AHN42728.1 hypothetical protein HPOKI673_07180 [Helicobacter pylori oki673]AHN44173.1 hypothetical protein HPOKI828_07200 [Helicobacter pylori oki828]